MRAFIALIVWTLCLMLPGKPVNAEPVIIPPVPSHAPIAGNVDRDEQEWAAFYVDAYCEYADAFTALFNSYSYKRTRNGRSMINGKFVKMGA